PGLSAGPGALPERLPARPPCRPGRAGPPASEGFPAARRTSAAGRRCWYSTARTNVRPRRSCCRNTSKPWGPERGQQGDAVQSPESTGEDAMTVDLTPEGIVLVLRSLKEHALLRRENGLPSDELDNLIARLGGH